MSDILKFCSLWSLNFKNTSLQTFKSVLEGTWLAEPEMRAALDLGVMRSGLTLGVEITKK